MELESLKAILKGILASARKPITLEQLKTEYEDVAFESLEDKMFELGYGGEKGWNDPQIWKDFSLIMQRLPNGLIQCHESELDSDSLVRLITGTKSKKGKTGRLSMSSQSNVPSRKKKKQTTNPKPLKSTPATKPSNGPSLIPSRKKKETKPKVHFKPSQAKPESPLTTDSDECDENVSPVTTDSDEELNAFAGNNRPSNGPK